MSSRPRSKTIGEFSLRHPFWFVLILGAITSPLAGIPAAWPITWAILAGLWLGWKHGQGQRQLVPATPISEEIPAAPLDPDDMLPVVGTRFYKGINHLPGGEVSLVLRREPRNPHDANAIAVWSGRWRVGHISADHARELAAGLDAAGGVATVRGLHLAGGSVLAESPEPSHGDVLEDMRASSWLPLQVWGRLTVDAEVAGERDHRAGVRRVFEQAGVDPGPGGYQLDDVPTILIPNPAGAPTVVCAGAVVGTLEIEDAGAYVPLFQLLFQSQRVLAVTARVWGLHDGLTRGRVTVHLPRADEVQPPMALPSVPFTVVPPGRRVQVIGEEQHIGDLNEIAQGHAQLSAVATLDAVTVQRPRSVVELVEVRILDRPVGTLSKTVSEQFLPLVKVLLTAGRVPVVRALVEGNQVTRQVVLDVARPTDLPSGWIDENVAPIGMPAEQGPAPVPRRAAT